MMFTLVLNQVRDVVVITGAGGLGEALSRAWRPLTSGVFKPTLQTGAVRSSAAGWAAKGRWVTGSMDGAHALAKWWKDKRQIGWAITSFRTARWPA